MNMDQTIRGCQIREHIGDCTSRKFQKAIVEECGCSPIFSNFSKQEVNSRILNKIYNKKNILVWK